MNFQRKISIFPSRTGWPSLLPMDIRNLEAVLAAMCEVLENHGHSLDALDLHLVDDQQICEINFRYLSRTGPTNIISFPANGNMPGILVLSLDTFSRECFIYHQNPQSHLLRLLSHGLGHLAGYDHGEKMDRICMVCMQAAMNMAIKDMAQ